MNQAAARLVVDALTLARGGRVLFSELSFAADGGGFVELRGPNGAGKTSLLRALAGFLRPVSGRIAVGEDQEAQLALHYVGHLDALKPGLDGRAHLRFWRGLFGGGDDAVDALGVVGLGSIGDLPARALSQGQRRRLALARLIAAPRPIWLLDEPAAALDQSGKAMLEGLIARHRERGGLVVAALHEPLAAPGAAVIELGAAR